MRKVRIEAPRGDIVDRDGRVLVKTRVAAVVQIVPGSLPDVGDRAGRRVPQAAQRGRAGPPGRRVAAARARARHPGEPPRADARASAASAAACRAPRARPGRSTIPAVPADELKLRRLYRRLGRVIRVKPRRIHQRVIEGIAELPYSNVTIKTAVEPRGVQLHPRAARAVPGVEVEKQYLRDYPHKELAAQLFGTTREISPAELKEKRYKGVEPGTRIGADGLEEKYDKYLRGKDGYTRIVINALGNPRRPAAAEARRAAPGPAAADHARPRPPARGERRDQARRRGRGGERRQGRRVRGDGPAQRRGARARLVPELRRQRVRQADLAEALRRARAPRTTARRCSTARSPPRIRRARRSSRSPRWRRWRRA